ncbi:MAG: PocR ligand-binding domain-containing protein [Candidatus Sedimenticola endophacoides]
MRGDIRVVKGESEVLSELPEFLATSSERYRTVYVLLRDLLASERMNELFRDFHQMVGVPAAIIDLQANVLASSSWQRLCTDFHRAVAGTRERCIESDMELANQLQAGRQFTSYRCKNGLTDCASPIVIEGEHVANLFIGQFLLEPPDPGFFQAQAEAFGFDRDAYMEALSEVPVIEEGRVLGIMRFLVAFAQLIGHMGLERLKMRQSEEMARHSLEREVAERTEALQHQADELRRTRDAAEAANRSKSVFLANMSHELRTPLNAILGFARLMQRDGNLPGEQRRHLEVINSSGEHLLGMINDVLDMSKIEAGQLPVLPAPVDLWQLLEDIREMVRLRAEAKGLRFRLERDPDLPRYLETDSGRLRQILINLLVNAVKYTPEGGIAVRAATVVSDAGCLRLKIEVEDSSIGIEPDRQGLVFEPFVQAGGSGGEEGAGLGLAIARRLARLLGGDITLRSEPARGSVFSLFLPLRVAREVVPAAGRSRGTDGDRAAPGTAPLAPAECGGPSRQPGSAARHSAPGGAGAARGG